MDDKIKEIISILKKNGHWVADEENVVNIVRHVTEIYKMYDSIESTKDSIEENMKSFRDDIRQTILIRSNYR